MDFHGVPSKFTNQTGCTPPRTLAAEVNACMHASGRERRFEDYHHRHYYYCSNNDNDILIPTRSRGIDDAPLEQCRFCGLLRGGKEKKRHARGHSKISSRRVAQNHGGACAWLYTEWLIIAPGCCCVCRKRIEFTHYYCYTLKSPLSPSICC